MTTMLDEAPRVVELADVTAERFASEIAGEYRPVVMRGVAADWPGVAAAAGGPRSMAAYLRRFAGGRPLGMFVAPPEARGRFFYGDDARSFNFRSAQVTLPVMLDGLLAATDEPDPVAMYAGSAATAEAYPGWARENVLALPTPGAEPRLWLGNASRASTPYDMSDNVAVVVSGERRFVLFPPEAAPDLYVGPIENTIAGQPTSMVDVEQPDLARFPRFAAAARTMQVAYLKPGDAIFIPSLWWHDVTARGPFNVLVNYWWGQGQGGSPFAALMHAVMAIRDLPEGQRAAMRSWFDHLVFAPDASRAADHLPPGARGVLGPPSAARDRSIRQYLRRMLSALD